ncbi:putative exosome complex exonuclease [Vairimorpha necatrix]|uniref:Exosome complex exonuclease n=1 Tax=Vairimorpha necatrix TaxID=6039 RepID=A0AAX4JE18_9MICR
MNKIETTLGIIHKSKGSALYKCADTSVLCTVDFNNRHEQSKIEEYDKLSIDIKFRNINNKSYDEYYSTLIKSVLKKCILNIDICKSVYINLIVDSTSSNTLWCSINALFLGLIECGIPLEYSLYASTSFTNKEDVFLYDKTGKLIWYHGFCNIKSINMDSVYEFYKYVKEVQDFTIKKNLTI